VRDLNSSHQLLLWEDVPRELMPHFKPLCKDLPESLGESVDNYTFEERMASRTGIVYAALDRSGKKVVVKITEKSTIFTPRQVEEINRENRFLSSFIKHPSIIRGLDLLHGPHRVYLVTEHAGDHTMHRWLCNTPGNCLDGSTSLHGFSQLLSALAFCHDLMISHRKISLEHLAVRQREDGQLRLKLLDFRGAMIVKAGVTSCALCGALPCMAPEVLHAEPYWPIGCDCWSAGIVLLEMMGGLGSFYRAVQVSETEVASALADDFHRRSLAKQIDGFFQLEGSHLLALSGSTVAPYSRSLQNECAVEILTCLLQPPVKRKGTKEVYELHLSMLGKSMKEMYEDDQAAAKAGASAELHEGDNDSATAEVN